MNTAKYVIIFIIIWLSTSNLYSQKIVRSTGKAAMMQDNTSSATSAKAKVLELAKIDAIENAFGSYVEQDVRSNLRDGELTFNVIGSNKVKGEWIETVGEEKYTYQMREGTSEPEIWWTCEITGKIREVVKAKVDFDVKTLKKPDRSFETNRFKNGDDFYLSFVSASDGYLTVYVADEAETAYRILPYSTMTGAYSNFVPVRTDKNYIFFNTASQENYFENFKESNADELSMATEKNNEYNTIYVIFSKLPFTKPILTDIVTEDNLIFPKSVSIEKFDKWLSDNVIANKEFQFKKIRVEIWK